MTERPILFSAPMVRALLAGTKTQTRRQLSPQPPDTTHMVSTWHHPDPRPHFFAWTDNGEGGAELAEDGWRKPCPYGAPGDRLWVRETWGEWSDAAWHYAADLTILPKQRDRDLANFLAQRSPFTWESYKWRPSIHMPRAASRITLEVTGVRVERLHDISEADAVAEGTPCWVCGAHMDGRGEGDCHCFHKRATPADYGALWESINGPGSWDANPWVWVVEFKREG